MNQWDSSRRKDLEHVGDLVDGVVAAMGGREGLGNAALLWARWPDLAGGVWADATPVRLDRGQLVVAVGDARVATKLRYSTAELMERIEARIGPDIVSSVRIQVRRPQ